MASPSSACVFEILRSGDEEARLQLSAPIVAGMLPLVEEFVLSGDEGGVVDEAQAREVMDTEICPVAGCPLARGNLFKLMSAGGSYEPLFHLIQQAPPECALRTPREGDLPPDPFC